MITPRVQLTPSDSDKLEEMLHKTSLRSKVFKRVTALLELDKGKTICSVCDILGLSHPTISTLIAKYKSVGLDCLLDKKQPGRPPRIDGVQRAKITALACSKAPEGYAKWSLRLLAEKIVELNYCESISHEWTNQILKKTILKSTSKSVGVLQR